MHLSSLAARLARAVVVCLALTAAACSTDAPSVVAPPTFDANLSAAGQPDDLGPARAARARYRGRLLADEDILGTAIGRLADGRPEITVFARNAAAGARIARELDGVPVVVEVTGDITALPAVATTPRARPGSGTIKPTDRARPAYIGMSTGNANECASGTIGAKISKGGSAVYALSNNHVWARQNAAGANEKIYQPGRYDLGCDSGATYEWATLARFGTISFNGTNTADAALALVNAPNQLIGSTLPGGYGTPKSLPADAVLGMPVHKNGRTTGYTIGTIVGVDVDIRVQYSGGIATFVNQIQIKGDQGQFSRSGDSGSLIVTRDGNNPVGLLFAGGQTSTFANRIQDALAAVGGGTIVP